MESVDNFWNSPARQRKRRREEAANDESAKINVNIRSGDWSRVARWYIFKPFLVNFGEFYNGRCWYVIWQFGTFFPIGKFYGHLVHFVVIWCIFTVLVSCAKKNLATLDWRYSHTKGCFF
jgi:hypothetical protein